MLSAGPTVNNPITSTDVTLKLIAKVVAAVQKLKVGGFRQCTFSLVLDGDTLTIISSSIAGGHTEQTLIVWGGRRNVYLRQRSMELTD